MFEKYQIFYLIPPAPLKRGVKVPLFKGDLGGSLINLGTKLHFPNIL
jgi:hypothetical protein